MISLYGTALTLVLAASPAETALADAQAQPEAVRRNLRYLSLANLEDRKRAVQVLTYHANALSRKPSFGSLTVVGELVRLDIRDYGWKRSVWEKLAEVEPYYHVRQKGGLRYWAGGSGYGPGWYEEQGEIVATAPWMGPAKESQALVTLLQTSVPIVRADWFFYQTAIQQDRAVGYYDFLGLGKEQKDFQKLVGADPSSVETFGEVGAVVKKSRKVALNNRLLRRQRALGGNYWYTQDFKTSKKGQNVVQNRDGAKADASEDIGPLPNGLPVFGLFDGDGKRQDVAPDFIAHNTEATSVDGRVHINLTCLRCHGGIGHDGFAAKGVLHPIEDYVRKNLKRPLTLQTTDEAKHERDKQLYQSNLWLKVKRDVEDYDAATKDCCGLSGGHLAAAYGEFWDRYEEDVTLERAAQELGCTPQKLQQALARQLATVKYLDPVLAAFVADPPDTIRRDHWEEAYPLAAGYIRGVAALEVP